MTAEVSAAAPDYALRLGPREVTRYQLMAERARTAEADLWRLAGIVPGARIADVGCGPGALLPVLAAEVGPGGQVSGVDADPAAVGAAQAYTSGLPGVSVVEGRADGTGLPAGHFDVVMVRHVLAHNGGREPGIIAHLVSLLRPGGTLYLVDTYAPGAATVPEVPVITELDDRYRTFHATRGNDLRTGPRLGGWLRDAGLEVLDFRGRYQIVPAPPGLRPPAWAARDAMLESGVATGADLDRWEQALAELDDCPDRPTFFMPVFTALGRAA
ncbi:MAG TPA: methyltransferase domain-containing protein [Mycobacteriales bacterium]|nr:methyltransferase domain-containing protein [Mycobacteriales bacterium]